MDSSSSRLIRAAGSGWTALALFAGLSTAATWPLATGLGRDVPSDYGDPLYVAWALAWVSRQVGRMLTGDIGAFAGFWDANQLHPEPAALAYSDHFIAQALPVAPLYWATGNALLVLGVAYLIAFAACGFFAWLLVREITGSSAAGVVAGSAFAFNPFFLVYELPHLQVISAWGMPLALYGLRRFFEHGARAGVWLGAAGVVAVSLSAGYYMLMFPPFLLLYVAWEVTSRRRWADLRMWLELAAAGAASVMVMAPFVWPYLVMRGRMPVARTIDETTRMAATVDGYVAAVGPLAIAFAFAALALVAAGLMRLAHVRRPMPLLGFVVAGAALSFWLSLGPAPAWGETAWPALGLYRLLQDYLPGMDLVRVSSRFAVVFVLFLSMLAGMGAALVARRPAAGPVLVALAVVSMWLNAPTVFPLNRESPPTVDVAAPPAYLTPGTGTPAVYRYLDSLPDGTVVAELPFTDLWYNTRYLYFSTMHWHPLANGFTSFFPPAYIERARWLVNPVRTPDEAWRALQSGQATHVVVHRDAWDAAYGEALEAWLVSHGASRHGEFDGAVVYEIGPGAAGR